LSSCRRVHFNFNAVCLSANGCRGRCDFSFDRFSALAPRGVDDFPYCGSQPLVSGKGIYLLICYLYHDERFVMASLLRVILYDDAHLAMYLCGFIAPPVSCSMLDGLIRKALE
jgi:hypothetical protein